MSADQVPEGATVADYLEADDSNFSDQDGGSSYNSELTSLSSSVLSYEYENGRRYHGFRSGKYILPNDEREQERLDIFHHVWALLMGGKLTYVPLKKGKKYKALDIGTGTGIWAIDLGDAYPEIDVIGTDLSPIQPPWVPPNVQFEVDDIEDVWVFREKFDFIHSRMMLGAIGDWEKYIEDIYNGLASGGYAEFVEVDIRKCYSDDGKECKIFNNYCDLLYQAGEKMGKSTGAYDQLLDLVQKTGFTDISIHKLKIPCGSWPKDKKMKEIGLWGLEIAKTGVESYGLAALTRVLGMPTEEAEKIIADATADTQDRRNHSYWRGCIIVGKKPE